MTFGKKALSFYRDLKKPDLRMPEDIEVMNPLNEKETMRIVNSFYNKFYDDNNKRVFLIGINPGRFGGGITGIPFTDPVNLENALNIKCNFEKRHELSSRFVYEVIDKTGGPEKFFGSLYLTAVSPLGFIRNNKNLNYYDVPSIKSDWELWIRENLKKQLDFGARKDVAFSLGRGKNLEYLNYLNKDKKYFDKIIPLPHPRWVMQYRFKTREKFVEEYVENLKKYMV